MALNVSFPAGIICKLYPVAATRITAPVNPTITWVSTSFLRRDTTTVFKCKRALLNKSNFC
ncbi:hypothetical protein AN697_27925 [Enterobacter cloacae subsp. cloacae]|nr:hypothetical protein AN697_27925 [Enterobacter cloacae subsp. cloacae]